MNIVAHSHIYSLLSCLIFFDIVHGYISSKFLIVRVERILILTGHVPYYFPVLSKSSQTHIVLLFIYVFLHDYLTEITLL